MPNTNNPGVTNAGVFTLDAAGGLPAAGFALDAEAVASGGAFLASELEKRDMTIRKPLTSVTYPRDIPIKTGGGWVDYASAMAVAYGITGGSGEGAIHAGGANAIPSCRQSGQGTVQGACLCNHASRDVRRHATCRTHWP